MPILTQNLGTLVLWYDDELPHLISDLWWEAQQPGSGDGVRIRSEVNARLRLGGVVLELTFLDQCVRLLLTYTNAV
jgi:hypothetical protein